MPLTVNEHYAASAGYFFGGILSTVTNLWLLFDLLSALMIRKSLLTIHKQLAFANILVVGGFLFGGVSHFEQAWIFGPSWCKFYVVLSKFSCILAISTLSVCLWNEYQHCFWPESSRPNAAFPPLLLLAWANALFWGVGSITWAEYGQEPAGFTCTVLWYKVQPFMFWMTVLGFGIPATINLTLAFSLWKHGKTRDQPLTSIAVALCVSILVQYAGYASAYVAVLLGYRISLYVLAFIPVWTKSTGIIHPFIYSHYLSVNSEKQD